MNRKQKRAALAGILITGALAASAAGACVMNAADEADALLSCATDEYLAAAQPRTIEYLPDIQLSLATAAPDEPQEPAEELTALGEYRVTYYCACPKCCGKSETDPAYGITATGTKATEGRTVAVDPRVIPYGSELLVRYSDGTETRLVAEDCGGAIKGRRLDIYMASHEAALVEGVKTAEIYIVGGKK